MTNKEFVLSILPNATIRQSATGRFYIMDANVLLTMWDITEHEAWINASIKVNNMIMEKLEK